MLYQSFVSPHHRRGLVVRDRRFSAFAWYQVGTADISKGSVTTNNLITAEADTYTAGALTLTPSFVAVTGELPTYVPQDQEAGHFENVALTDAKGDTYVKVEGQDMLIKANSQNTDWYGTAKVSVAITFNDEAVTLGGSANDQLAPYVGTYAVTVAPDTNSHARVRATAPGTRGESNAASASGVTFNIIVSDQGVVTTSLSNNATELQFWYFASPVYEGSNDGVAQDPQQVYDQTSDHTADAIKVTIA